MATPVDLNKKPPNWTRLTYSAGAGTIIHSFTGNLFFAYFRLNFGLWP